MPGSFERRSAMTMSLRRYVLIHLGGGEWQGPVLSSSRAAMRGWQPQGIRLVGRMLARLATEDCHGPLRRTLDVARFERGADSRPMRC